MVPDTMSALAWLRKHLDGEGGNDIVREMVKVFAEELMSAEADNACGASWGERSLERVNSRNGDRSRDCRPVCRRPAAGQHHPLGAQQRPPPRFSS